MADSCICPTNLQVGVQEILCASERHRNLFSHPPPNSNIVDGVISKGRQHQFKSTLYDCNWKRLDLFCRNSATLQFLVANCHALLAKYDCQNYAKLSFISAIVVRQSSWLHLSGFPKEVQLTVEDHPFDGTKIFTEMTHASLHTLKDSRATLWSLRICTPGYKRKCSPPFISIFTEIIWTQKEEAQIP